MKQAMLAVLIASAACDDGWKDQVSISASTITEDGTAISTQVSVDVYRWIKRGHDHDRDPVWAVVEVGGTATDLVPTNAGEYGGYSAPLGPIDELHLRIDGVQLSQPMPRLIAELTTPSPGSVATVLVTSGEGDQVRVSVDGIYNGPACGASSDGIRFEILPGCVPSPGRYRMSVHSSRDVLERDVNLEETFGGTAPVDWRLSQYAGLTFDVP